MKKQIGKNLMHCRQDFVFFWNLEELQNEKKTTVQRAIKIETHKKISGTAGIH